MNILDASALIAFLKKENGWQTVHDLFAAAESKGISLFIHQINFSEVIYFSLHFFGETKTKAFLAALKSPFLGIVNYFDTDLSLYAAHLKAHYALSLADAIGLAYTKIMDGCFWTADRLLEPIAEKEKIELKLVR